MRWVSTRVLPEPAPAMTSSGPSPCTTASRWEGFRPSRSSVCAATRSPYRRPLTASRPDGVRASPSAAMAPGRIQRLRTRVTEATEWAMTTAWRPVVIARAAYERDRDIGGGLLAGALAFRLFVWLAAFCRRHRGRPRLRRRRGRRPRRGTRPTAASRPSPPPGGQTAADARERPVAAAASAGSTPCSRPAARWPGRSGRPSAISWRVPVDPGARRSRAHWPTTG